MYVLSRGDLPPGLQAAQAAHAAFQFALEHPEVTRRWHQGSNCLVLLSVPDETSLVSFAETLAAAGVPCSLVVEPDIGDEHTALAVAPTGIGNAFAHLPLHGREVAMS